MGIAVVTGANRGLGLDTVRQLAALGHTVFLGSRDLVAGTAAARELGSPAIRAVELDVTNQKTIEAAARQIEAVHGVVDMLVNNAAVHYDTWQAAVAPDFDIVDEAMRTNVYGAWQTALAMLPMLKRSTAARIVNVSSGAGALTGMGGGTPAYRLSKVGINAVTRMLAAELAVESILVNSVCPGWVATDMGGSGGRPVEEGAAGIVWAATLPDGGPTGGFFRDRQPIDW